MLLGTGIDRGAMLDKDRHNSQMTILRRPIEGGITVFVLAVEFGAVTQQLFDFGNIAFFGRRDEWEGGGRRLLCRLRPQPVCPRQQSCEAQCRYNDELLHGAPLAPDSDPATKFAAANQLTALQYTPVRAAAMGQIGENQTTPGKLSYSAVSHWQRMLPGRRHGKSQSFRKSSGPPIVTLRSFTSPSARE